MGKVIRISIRVRFRAGSLVSVLLTHEECGSQSNSSMNVRTNCSTSDRMANGKMSSYASFATATDPVTERCSSVFSMNLMSVS